MYATAMNGSGANNVGIGVSLAAVAQQFTQGNITTTENPLDMAINGSGFFQIRRPQRRARSTPATASSSSTSEGYVVNNGRP